jgi:hypothetical protein
MHQVLIYAAIGLLVFLPGPDALIIVWLGFIAYYGLETGSERESSRPSQGLAKQI